MEEWRNTEGFDNHQVSNYGNVRSLDFIDSRGTLRKGQMCKQTVGYGGHLYIGTTKKGVTKRYAVHRLVARAFPETCGEWFEGCEVHHIDGNPANNNAKNLVCLTKEEHIRIHRPPKPDRWARWKYNYLR